MKTRRQRINQIRTLATQPPAYLTQAHCDVLNKYHEPTFPDADKEPHKPGPIDPDKKQIHMMFFGQDQRDQFSKEWDALPQLPIQLFMIFFIKPDPEVTRMNQESMKAFQEGMNETPTTQAPEAKQDQPEPEPEPDPQPQQGRFIRLGYRPSKYLTAY